GPEQRLAPEPAHEHAASPSLGVLRRHGAEAEHLGLVRGCAGEVERAVVGAEAACEVAARRDAPDDDQAGRAHSEDTILQVPADASWYASGMSTQVVVTLPDEVYASARRLAELMQREVAEVITDALRLAIPSLRPAPAPSRPVESLSDAEVLALTDLQ